MKNEETKVTVEETVGKTEQVEEETKEGFLTKAARGLKKHGKKIAAAAVIGTVGLIGYALGSRSNNDDLDVVDTYELEGSHSELSREAEE